ncbi:MAG TPA: HEAT repeat domain-containing protein [Rudaea sp.]
MQPFSRTMSRALIAAALLIATADAPAAGDAEMAPADKQLNQLYWQGQEALKDSDWNAALQRFSDLEKQLRAREPQSVDTAIYWQAYALAQARRGTEAKAAVERLHRDFPKSRWGKDADALLRTAQPAATRTTDAGDADMAEAAVESLLNAPPDRALPLLKKVLQSQHPDKVKKRALFVLSQIDAPGALDAVVDVAKNGGDRELREEAIRMLGVSGNERAIERLRELYAGSPDARQKGVIVQAWLTADRKDLILAAARTETDAAARREAIRALGALDAATELKQLFDATSDAANRREIVQALGVAGNVSALAAIADSQQPDEIREDALHALGVAGDEGGKEALVKLYPKLTSPRLREAALQGLLIAGDTAALLALYKQAKSKEEKQALLRTITATDSEAALNLIEAELGKRGDSHD